jgi:addiction module RelE/StbE family toxin
MTPYYHRSFKKSYKKLPRAIQFHFDERVAIFLKTPYHPLLNNHTLHGRWEGHRSINITGDFRAIFKVEGTAAIFVDIDTHSNLYV